jgi:hypothetical protein
MTNRSAHCSHSGVDHGHLDARYELVVSHTQKNGVSEASGGILLGSSWLQAPRVRRAKLDGICLGPDADRLHRARVQHQSRGCFPLVTSVCFALVIRRPDAAPHARRRGTGCACVVRGPHQIGDDEFWLRLPNPPIQSDRRPDLLNSSCSVAVWSVWSVQLGLGLSAECRDSQARVTRPEWWSSTCRLGSAQRGSQPSPEATDQRRRPPSFSRAPPVPSQCHSSTPPPPIATPSPRCYSLADALLPRCLRGLPFPLMQDGTPIAGLVCGGFAWA